MAQTTITISFVFICNDAPNEITHISHTVAVFFAVSSMQIFPKRVQQTAVIYSGFLLQPFSRRRGRPCLLISHISAQDGECVAGMKKETFPSCLVSPPTPQFFLLLSLSSAPLRRCKSKQTAVQAPQIITQESHWERCVGSGCDSMCAAVFTDIHLHMSRPRPIKKKRGRGSGARFFRAN